jgi:nucleoid DNA-binding protein
MDTNKLSTNTVSRRAVIRGGTAVAGLLGIGVATLPRQVTANKAELIDSIASEADVTSAAAERVLDAFIDTTTKALKKGNRVALTGFGSFSVSKRSARKGRNPQTGKEIKLPAKKVVRFRASDELAAALDLVPGAGDERRLTAREERAHKKRTAHPNRRGKRERRPRRGRDHREHRERGPRDGHHRRGGDQKTLVTIDATLLVREAELSKADAKRALDAFIDTTTKALKKGNRVALTRFGSFSISKRSARKGRNPQTGKEIKIPAKKVVKFKPGAELSEKIK